MTNEFEVRRLRNTTRQTDIGRVDWPRMTESIPHADEADLAEQAQSIDDDGDNDVLGEELGDSREADAADVLDQKLEIYGAEDVRRDS